MYPKNAASPEPIAIGAVVQISDGAVQTSGCTVRIKPVGVAEGDGAGTTAYSTDGIVLYTPTQAETNYTSFILIAKKTGCIPVSVMVVTSASGTAGYAGLDWGAVANKTTTNALTGTTIATTQKVDVETIKTNPVVNGGTATFPTNATLASTTNITAAAGCAVSSIGANVITAAAAAADFGAELQALITGGAYALSTDANGRIRIVDGTGTGEINTNAGAIALVDLVTDITTKTGFRLSATGVDDIWDEVQSGHSTAGTFGKYLDSAVSGVSTGGISASDIATAVWQDLLSGSDFSTVGSVGKLLKDDVNATISSRSSHSATDVWAAGTRTLTGLGFTLAASDLASGIITAAKFAAGAIDAAATSADFVTEIRAAITGGAYAIDTDANGRVRIVDGTGTGEIDTTSGGVAVSATSVRTAVGLASANLDTQFDALPTAAENAAALLDLTDGIETGVTPRQLLRGVGAALFGLVTGAGTGTEVFKGAGQTSGGTTRLTYTVDSSGNRSGVTLNL
jgi:hypothetical protein